MGLEQVKKEILEKAHEEAKQIVGRGKKEAEEIMNKTKEEINSCSKSANEDSKKLTERMERKIIAAAEFDVKKMKLDKKKEMIDRVFNRVGKKLVNLSEKKREANIKRLLAKAKKEIEVRYVHANKADSRIVSKIPKVEYKETDITGGIVAESPDLNFSVDMSYDELLEEIRKKHLQEIAKKIFG